MVKKDLNVIGINPGTRYLGIAIFQNSELLDWRIKTFPGKWTKEKTDKILAIIRQQIEHYDIKKIIIKKLHPSRSSKNLKFLVAKMTALVRRRRIDTQRFSIKELEKTFVGDMKPNKQNLAESIVRQYPALVPELNKEKSSKNSYHLRMIEAVALAAACSH
jgi:Holliday junction resolvasome RuvABC endonuclease subunit